MAYVARQVYEVFVDNTATGIRWDNLEDAEAYMVTRLDPFYTIEYMDIRDRRVYTEVPD